MNKQMGVHPDLDWKSFLIFCFCCVMAVVIILVALMVK